MRVRWQHANENVFVKDPPCVFDKFRAIEAIETALPIYEILYKQTARKSEANIFGSIQNIWKSFDKTLGDLLEFVLKKQKQNKIQVWLGAFYKTPDGIKYAEHIYLELPQKMETQNNVLIKLKDC